jgi:hypothetical protein
MENRKKKAYLIEMQQTSSPPTRRNLEQLAITVLLGSALMVWSVATHGFTGLNVYLFAGLLVGAMVVVANADNLLSGNGWRGVLALTAATFLWAPAFYILFGMVLNDKTSSSGPHSPPSDRDDE